MSKHRFQRGGRIFDQLCGQCNAPADADIHQMGDIERAAQSTQPAPETGGEWRVDKWDRSGLKEASQRALELGRTHQEFDIVLLLEMLQTIETLERQCHAVPLLVAALKECQSYVELHTPEKRGLRGSLLDTIDAALAAVSDD